jgi:hypothetical protein
MLIAPSDVPGADGGAVVDDAWIADGPGSGV